MTDQQSRHLQAEESSQGPSTPTPQPMTKHEACEFTSGTGRGWEELSRLLERMGSDSITHRRTSPFKDQRRAALMM